LRTEPTSDDYVTNTGPWREGDTIYADGRPVYRITDVIPLAEAEPYDRMWRAAPIF
jgi:hypothetical protein